MIVACLCVRMFACLARVRYVSKPTEAVTTRTSCADCMLCYLWFRRPASTRTLLTPPQPRLLHVANRPGAARQTLCFEGHNLTIVAADGYLTKPLVVSCLDINLGQRCAATEAQSPCMRVACNIMR